MVHEVARDRPRHYACEERADVERGANGPYVRPRDSRANEALAQISEIGAAERLREQGVGAAAGREAVVLGDDNRELRPPLRPAGALQPRVLSPDRRREIVQRRERVEVVKGGGYGKLVVAIGVLEGDRTGEIQDAVGVSAVAVVARVVTPCVVAVRAENLLDERMGMEDLDDDRTFSHGAPRWSGRRATLEQS